MKIEQLKAYGPKALIVSFSSTDTPYKDVVRLQDFARHLKSKKALALEDILISHFNLNLVFQKPISVTAVSPQLHRYWEEFTTTVAAQKTNVVWELPVCFDAAYAPDLYTHFKQDIPRVEDFIKALCQHELYVHFFGFLPGFAYLGGLPKELQLPRHGQPRLQVPKGAFALGGPYAAVYPQASPGGWQLIGQTPFIFFDVQRTPPVFLNPGDRIKVASISRKDYLAMQTAYNQQAFAPKKLPQT